MCMDVTRKKLGKKYKYFIQGREITNARDIERINKLAIPPAWNNVMIATSPKNKVQATGIDTAGRKQSIYSPQFRAKQEAKKYQKILEFAERLPALRKQVERDLVRKKFTKEKVVACVVRLIDEQFFRVGNKQYAKEHQHYGLTTLRSKHIVEESTSSVTFSFIGKSGQKHVKKITNPQIVRIIRALDDMPGYEIFRYVGSDGELHDVTSTDVNSYIKEHMGNTFSAKDFRTWGGTLLASSLLLEHDLESSRTKKAKKKAVTYIVKRVAWRLGNTPAVARSSYIDPKILNAIEDDASLSHLQKAMQKMRPKKYRSVDEQCVLKLLQAS